MLIVYIFFFLISSLQFVELVHCRARRRMIRGLKRKPMALIKRIRKSKAEATGEDKPAVIKTHLRNMIVVPEMIGGVVGIHSGKTFNQVEIKVILRNYFIYTILMSMSIFVLFSPSIGLFISFLYTTSANSLYSFLSFSFSLYYSLLARNGRSLPRWILLVLSNR